MNDEAHHAYRIRRDEPDEEEGNLFGDDDEAEDFYQEATVWINGLDRIQRKSRHQLLRRSVGDAVFPGPRRAGDESAVPVGRQRFRPDRRHRIGADKDPAIGRPRHDRGRHHRQRRRDTQLLQHLEVDSGNKLTPAERGAKRANPKPEAILKYANTPIAMLGGLWEQELSRLEEGGARSLAGVHHRLQDHAAGEDDVRMARRREAANGPAAVQARRFPQQRRQGEHHPRRFQSRSRVRHGRSEERRSPLDALHAWTPWARPIGRWIARDGRNIPTASRSWRRSWSARCHRRAATCAAS